MHTDLPLPVAPATSKCGSLLSSAVIGSPEISLPNATSNLLVVDFISFNTSFNVTIEICSFGTSIPTADLPGIGASILISLAARLRAISLLKFTILFTLTP